VGQSIVSNALNRIDDSLLVVDLKSGAVVVAEVEL